MCFILPLLELMVLWNGANMAEKAQETCFNGGSVDLMDLI